MIGGWLYYKAEIDKYKQAIFYLLFILYLCFRSFPQV